MTTTRAATTRSTRAGTHSGTITPLRSRHLRRHQTARLYDGTTTFGRDALRHRPQDRRYGHGSRPGVASKNVLGTDLSTLGVLAGYVVHDTNSGGNYTVDSSGTHSGTISKAPLDISAVTRQPAPTTARRTRPRCPPSPASRPAIRSRVSAQAFASKNVLGTDLSTLGVLAGYTVVHDTNSGGNYTVDSTGTHSGTITKAPLTISAVTDSRLYDGTTTSAGTPSVTGLKTGDTVTGLAQAYASKNVLGTDLSTLSVLAGYVVMTATRAATTPSTRAAPPAARSRRSLTTSPPSPTAGPTTARRPRPRRRPSPASRPAIRSRVSPRRTHPRTSSART